MSSTPKHRAISRELAAQINSGKYPEGVRLPSEIQLVSRFGVSRPTVIRALRDLQEQGLIERRAGSGSYVRAALGSSAMARSSHVQFGLIVPSLRRGEIFESICGELAALARVHDIGLLWGGGAHPPATATDMTTLEAETLCAQFIERGVAGVFFVPFEHRADRDIASQRIVEKLGQAGIPVVLLDHDIGPFPTRSGFDLVGTDNFAGGYFLAEHLIKLGARRLAYVTLPHTAPTVDARIAGAHAAMIAHGIEVPRRFVQSGDPADAKFVRGFVAARQLDGVLCTSDYLAAQLLQTLTRLRVRVPKDLRMVGFDNVPFASLLTIPLTTMEQPCRDIAITAFNALRDRLANPTLPPRTLMLAPRMVVRESCGAYLPPARN